MLASLILYIIGPSQLGAVTPTGSCFSGVDFLWLEPYLTLDLVANLCHLKGIFGKYRLTFLRMFSVLGLYVKIPTHDIALIYEFSLCMQSKK